MFKAFSSVDSSFESFESTDFTSKAHTNKLEWKKTVSRPIQVNKSEAEFPFSTDVMNIIAQYSFLEDFKSLSVANREADQRAAPVWAKQCAVYFGSGNNRSDFMKKMQTPVYAIGNPYVTRPNVIGLNSIGIVRAIAEKFMQKSPGQLEAAFKSVLKAVQNSDEKIALFAKKEDAISAALTIERSYNEDSAAYESEHTAPVFSLYTTHASFFKAKAKNQAAVPTNAFGLAGPVECIYPKK